ncbi:hypothetical protein QVD17_10942 [Tagetes erecta]|uniref:Ribosomal protein L30 ferredoxin-like fold domain-containing protein n=1 Tax=Tagetes erecta TaxID=13708 RepID=A0AAD8L246_TARER|nr:hypothetical protein QVD17_10942 [Tagetes erecta]
MLKTVIGRFGRRTGIRTSERTRLSTSKRFSTNNKPGIEQDTNGEKSEMLTHHDSYRDLDKLDFMTATKILFTTPPKNKKFGLDFHLVQLFFVCLPSLAVYLVAQYARHEMKKMDAELEKRQIEESKKLKATEEEVLKSNPHLLEVKERLESLEKTVSEIVTESKNQRDMKVLKQNENDQKQRASSTAVEPSSNKQASNKQETQQVENQKATQDGSTSDANFIHQIPAVLLTIMADEEPKSLDYVNEIVLKKRKNNEDWAIRRREQLQQRVKKSKSDNFVIKKPEQFIREYRDREIDLIKMKHRAKRPIKSSSLSQSKLLFVIRIQGKTDMHPQTRKLLYSLRLRRKFTGVFLKANDRNLEVLQKVEPYVAYGYPNLKSVNELVYKKGLAKFNKQLCPLTDNNIIEQALGEHKIICIEDVVNEIANVGPHFKEVCHFLCPFSLNKPEKALQGKKKPFRDGGDSGNRGDQINDLVSKMN